MQQNYITKNVQFNTSYLWVCEIPHSHLLLTEKLSTPIKLIHTRIHTFKGFEHNTANYDYRPAADRTNHSFKFKQYLVQKFMFMQNVNYKDTNKIYISRQNTYSQGN